ncbi:MAG: PQQ-binding-like beta-propeller repeat protein, partial [Candidatus Korobacteraceae bacterium]
SWKDYGGSADNSHYIVSDKITKSNVSQLELAWNYPTGDNNVYQFNPLVVDNVMYVLAKNNSLVALDATMGKEIWVHENLTGIGGRGLNYWESKDRKERRILFQINQTLQAIDANTGKSILTFGEKGVVNLREGLGRDPATVYRAQSGNPGKVFENLLILGSATGEGYFATPGSLRAFDVRTGKIVWQFITIPRPGEYGYDTWPKDAWRYIGGANTWGELTIDEKRGIAYFPTGSPTYDYYGADRTGANLFANCLLALDVRTGKRLWHYQFVHHDLWDYDGTSAPQLLTLNRNGRKVDAVAIALKQGFVFVFDRVTGKPVFPIEERPVPKSDMPGEQAWPTQPFPTAPPPFTKQRLTADEINPYILNDKERAEWKERIAASHNLGLYTPPTTKDTVSIPGAIGGANWGATAANPADGTMYVLSHDAPSIYKLSKEMPGGGAAAAAARRARARAQAQASGEAPPVHPGRAVYEQNCQACHGAEREGMGGSIPSLQGVVQRLGEQPVRQVIAGGRGQMPAFAEMAAADLNELVSFLADPTSTERHDGVEEDGAAATAAGWTAPVAGSGGAPIPEEMKSRMPSGPSQYGGMGGPPYPSDLDIPWDRYYTGYGITRHITRPPWSTLTAYDLNKGTIKWQVPLGEDVRAVAEGARNTGTMLEHKGAIVMSSGLVFVAARDGKIRAYDAADGKEVWSAQMPAGARAIPAYYEIGGRPYLVVAATTRVPQLGATGSGDGRDAGAEPEPPNGLKKGYVAFTLPAKAKPAQGATPPSQ